jgi:sialic acid synthase SpsE/protoporphyrinogen oxidase
MEKVKHIYIIGAGPSGLISGLELLKAGNKVTIIEKSNISGGMCRTWKENDYLLDTGPHIYHTPDKELVKHWKKHFGEVLVEGEFWSKNVYNGDLNNLVDYPISWESINNFKEPVKSQVLQELNSCNQAKSIGAKNFHEYVKNLVGPTLTKMFFTKYPQKVWGKSTTELTADWAPKRIEIREKITPFYQGQFAAVGKFGTGSVYNLIEKEFTKLGGTILFDKSLIGVDKNIDSITKLHLNDKTEIEVEEIDIVISTIPITILGNLLGVKTELKFRGIASVYISTKKELLNWPKGIHWLYFDSEKYSFNRITNSTKLSKNVSPEGYDLITIETTYSKGDDIDKFSKNDLENLIKKQIIELGLLTSKGDIDFISSNKEPYVYPLQYPGFQFDLSRIKSKIESFQNLYSVGTGGDFNYADSQVIFYKAFDLVKIISEKESKLNQTKKVKSRVNFNKIVHIGGHEIGGADSQPLIIGEIGLNHNGNYQIAIDLIDSALKCGLKFIKLQTYKSGNDRVSDKVKSANYVEKITEQEETLASMFDKFNMTHEQQIQLFKYAREKGLIIFSTPFDQESAIFLNDILEVDCFKIASVDLVNLPLIEKVASFNKPIILSCGMSNLSEIEDALDVISKQGNTNVILLHCNSSYPAPIEEMNLNVINTLKNSFKVPVGLSDHTFGLFTSIVSMSIGADVIERHFTLDRFMEGPDHILSSEPAEMQELVEKAKIISLMKGDGIKRVQSGEYFNINLQRKCLYANKDLKVGDIIKLEDIIIKGPAGGILPKYQDIILGKKLVQNIEKDFPINWDCF